MEIALQPCGFLSAYMGTIIGRESQDLYFRNLDCEGNLVSWPDTKERTITNHVQLLSSNSLDDVIIQKYSFELYWGEELFYHGNSSFGYFPLAMLSNQVGLDGEKSGIPWLESNPNTGEWQENKTTSNLNGQAHLPEIDRLWISPNGGSHSKGYVFVDQKLTPDAWFYQAHFYQDPVMPGSLGVETMVKALSKAVGSWGLPEDLHWKVKSGSKTIWKYRGQITPNTENFLIDLHVTNIARTASGWEITANGNLWKDSKRIYQVQDLSLEGQ
jgi:3-hydroxymyristoyl/3-hydroxydecanoyl-(acyl carrier protein) dehydratase